MERWSACAGVGVCCPICKGYLLKERWSAYAGIGICSPICKGSSLKGEMVCLCGHRDLTALSVQGTSLDVLQRRDGLLMQAQGLPYLYRVLTGCFSKERWSVYAGTGMYVIPLFACMQARWPLAAALASSIRQIIPCIANIVHIVLSEYSWCRHGVWWKWTWGIIVNCRFL